MARATRQDREWLLRNAAAVAEILRSRSHGTRLRIRFSGRPSKTYTDGWGVIIGRLGRKGPSLEIWLDHFSGHPERKLYACFRSYKRAQVTALTKQVSRKLWPIRTVKTKDTAGDRHVVLAERLRNSEFNVPILELYPRGETYYGIYNPTRTFTGGTSSQFCSRAVAFFEDVVHALPGVGLNDEHHDVYPKVENRKLVVSHIQRERSRLLATERKILDGYVCQVCGLDYKVVYGQLGSDFAEAHHRVPLSKLRGSIKTCIDDLATVCANCHRMLHRMPGERSDIEKLRSLVLGRRKRINTRGARR